MPIFNTPYPQGIDYYIEVLWQTPMYQYLLNRWGINTGQYNCFPRAYRNYSKEKGGYIPEFYNPNTDYTINNYVGSDGTHGGGLFFDNRFPVISFFGLLDPIRSTHADTAQDTARIELIFFVNLTQITVGGIPLDKQAGQRLDDVCANDVVNWIKRRGGSTIEVIEQYRDVDKVLERYSGELKKLALLDDMQPYFCFKVICELKYNTLLKVGVLHN